MLFYKKKLKLAKINLIKINFMENSFLFRIEIIIFFSSFFYIIYYLYEKIIIIWKNIKNIIAPDKKHIEKKIEKIKNIKNKQDTKEEKNKIKKLTAKDSKKIAEIIKRTKLNKSKWYLDTAKSLIIEGLAIDKLNKDLNLHLASIYEEEGDYKKAEYIYIDLLDAYKDNFEVLKKIAYNLAIQQRYEDSIEYYLKAYHKNKADLEVVEHLADLTYQVKFYKKALKFINQVLKQNPRNSEKLKMKAFCYETLWEIENAINTYKKVLEIQPYNSQVQEKLDYLESQK